MARIAKRVAAELVDISVGCITIRAKRPFLRHLARVDAEGRHAAIILADALLESDADLIFEPGIPVFSADPKDPRLVIRQLDGRAARGYFKDGRFVEVL